MQYTEKIVNVVTGEEIIRPYTQAEIAEYEAQAALLAQAKAEQELLAAQRSVDKAELLSRLGITADEAALLFS